MKQINLNHLRDLAYRTACEHGFHDEERSLSHFKCLIVSELMEAVEAERKGRRANIYDFNDMLEKYGDFNRAFERNIKDTVEDELADTIIRLMDMAGNLSADLSGVSIYTYEETSREAYRTMSFTESTYDILENVCEIRVGKYEDTSYGITLCIEGIILLSQVIGCNIFKHIKMKMEYNKNRPYLHGKSY